MEHQNDPWENQPAQKDPWDAGQPPVYPQPPPQEQNAYGAPPPAQEQNAYGTPPAYGQQQPPYQNPINQPPGYPQQPPPSQYGQPMYTNPPPYAPPSYPVQPPVYNSYGYGDRVPGKDKATIGLVLSIAALVLVWFGFTAFLSIPLSIVGLVLSIQARKLMPPGVNGMAIAGMVLSIIALVLSVLFSIIVIGAISLFSWVWDEMDAYYPMATALFMR